MKYLLSGIINFFRFFAAFWRQNKGAWAKHFGVFPRKNTEMLSSDPPRPRGISRNMKYKLIFESLYLLLFILVFIGCKKEESLPANGEISIDFEFQPYLDRFVEEAKKRGKEIDFSDTGLTMKFSNLETGIAASCSEIGTDRRGSHILEFDRALWETATIHRKEFLVFHELGHCELGRQHKNDQLPNGAWKSLMRGSIEGAPLSGKNISRPVTFFGFRKQYYIDEIFDVTIAEPNWSEFSPKYDDISERRKELFFQIYNVKQLRKSFELINNNFELEMSFRRLNEAGEIGIKYGDLDQAYLFKLTSNNNVSIEWKGRTPLESEFYSDGSILDPTPYGLFFCNNLPIDGFSVNKMTIRRQEEITSFFLNEKFLFHVDKIINEKVLIWGINSVDNLNIESFELSTF